MASWSGTSIWRDGEGGSWWGWQCVLRIGDASRHACPCILAAWQHVRDIRLLMVFDDDLEAAARSLAEGEARGDFLRRPAASPPCVISLVLSLPVPAPVLGEPDPSQTRAAVVIRRLASQEERPPCVSAIGLASRLLLSCAHASRLL